MKRTSDFFTAIGFLTVLFGFAIAFFALPDQAFSVQENRSLRTRPTLTLASLANGDYATEINDYFSDQFPMRDTLVGWKGLSELAVGRGENDGILLGKNGYLARRLFLIKHADGSVTEDLDVPDFAHLERAKEGIERLGKGLHVPLTVLLAGRNIDVAASAFSYPQEYSDALISYMTQGKSENATYLDAPSLHRARFDAGESVYYKTDHHWTTRGAYLVYCEVLASFGMENEILLEDFFEKRTVSKDFYGSLWSAGGMKFVSPDQVEVWIGADEEDYEVTADGRTLEGFYQLSHLAKKDHYSIFLDGTHDVVTVRKKSGEARPTLLIPKDSYANSLAPFLARHFDLLLLNLSSKNDYTNVSHYAAECGADRVLIVYGLENAITADKLCRLK